MMGKILGRNKYIHYGTKIFVPNRFKEIKNDDDTKPNPDTGFWASRLDAEWGWAKWCKSIGYRYFDKNGYFIFTLSENAKVCHLYAFDDLLKLPQNEQIKSDKSWYFIDFEKSTKIYDAIELHMTDGFDSDLSHALYGWDCDCILILNKDIIIPIYAQ